MSGRSVRSASEIRMPNDRLAEVFTVLTVKDLAGSRSYRRGLNYLYEGRVGPGVGSDRRTEATVAGTVPYLVRLWAEGHYPRWSCTCPAAEDGSFCKHCVAVALALDPDAAPSEVAVRSGHRRPQMAAHPAGGEGDIDLGVWRRRLKWAYSPGGDFVSYREAGEWASGIHAVIDNLESLCDDGHHHAVATLVEVALKLTDAAVGYIDDSGGEIVDILDRLADVHYRACQLGRPDPKKLAKRLLDLEVSTEVGLHRAAATYADVLGETGLTAYRRLIEPRWRRVNPDRDGYLGSDAFALHQCMLGWALGTGDPDALIEVHSRGKMLPGAVLEVCQALQAAGRGDEAIEWARRGLRKHRDRQLQLGGLREFLSSAWQELGEVENAIGLFWDAFRCQPSLGGYRRLLEESAGMGEHGDWSARCEEELRSRLAEREVDGKARSRGVARGAATVLVEILFFEGRREDAWSTGLEFGCDRRLWLSLARAREDSHPLDAVAVYEPEVFRHIERKNNAAYRSAVELMDRIRTLTEAAAVPDRFSVLVDRVRTEHRLKRNLMRLLLARRW